MASICTVFVMHAQGTKPQSVCIKVFITRHQYEVAPTLVITNYDPSRQRSPLASEDLCIVTQETLNDPVV